MTERRTPSAWSDGLRQMTELVTQLQTAARAAAVSGARITPPALAAQFADVTERMADLNRAALEPVQRALQEQERASNMLAEWSEQHQAISDQLAELAEQHRVLTDQMRQWAAPLLEQVTTLDEMRAAWSERSADDG